MNAKKRLSVGVIVACCALLGAALLGGTADAKKHKKNSKSVTVSKTTPTAIPLRATATSPYGVVNVPLTVGKKAKGKVVALDTLTITTSWTSAAAGNLNGLNTELIAPNGRTVSAGGPVFDPLSANEGPTTFTPNTSVRSCNAPTPPCVDPDQSLNRPFAGSVQNLALLAFDGVPAKGTWTVRVRNTSNTTTGTLSSVSITMSLMNKPA